MKPTLTVLHIGADDVLLASRGAVIASGGFSVLSARNVAQAALCIRARRIDVVIVCHTLSADERASVALLARRHRPALPVLLVSGGRGAAYSAGVDAVVDPHPRQLLAFLRELLQRPALAPLGRFPASRGAHCLER